VKGLLDNLAGTLAALTVGLLLLSVVHEYGYFWIIGSRLQTFLTTSDYFANAIVWLPFFILLMYFALDRDMLKGKNNFVRFGRIRGVKLKLLWLSVVVGIPIITLFVLQEGALWSTAGIISVLWYAYGVDRLPFANAEDETKRIAHRFMAMIPVIALFTFAWGLEQGVGDLKNTSEPYAVSLKSGEEQSGILLRTFDKGILFRTLAESQVEFLKWDQINKLYRTAPPVWQRSLLCRYFGVLCWNFSTAR
jgi:hypothetical protein